MPNTRRLDRGKLKVATRIGRGRRVRIAVGAGAYKFIVTIKDDGRLYIAPREKKGWCNEPA